MYQVGINKGRTLWICLSVVQTAGRRQGVPLATEPGIS